MKMRSKEESNYAVLNQDKDAVCQSLWYSTFILFSKGLRGKFVAPECIHVFKKKSKANSKNFEKELDKPKSSTIRSITKRRAIIRDIKKPRYMDVL